MQNILHSTTLYTPWITRLHIIASCKCMYSMYIYFCIKNKEQVRSLSVCSRGPPATALHPCGVVQPSCLDGHPHTQVHTSLACPPTLWGQLCGVQDAHRSELLHKHCGAVLVGDCDALCHFRQQKTVFAAFVFMTLRSGVKVWGHPWRIVLSLPVWARAE